MTVLHELKNLIDLRNSTSKLWLLHEAHKWSLLTVNEYTDTPRCSGEKKSGLTKLTHRNWAHTLTRCCGIIKTLAELKNIIWRNLSQTLFYFHLRVMMFFGGTCCWSWFVLLLKNKKLNIFENFQHLFQIKNLKCYFYLHKRNLNPLFLSILKRGQSTSYTAIT